MKLVNEFYSYQEQQNLIVTLKSQLIQLERDANKYDKYSDSKPDEVKSEERPDDDIIYNSEQKMLQDRYEALLRSKDTTISNLESKVIKLKEQLIAPTIDKSKFNDLGFVILKNQQQMLVSEIVNNLESSFTK